MSELSADEITKRLDLIIGLMLEWGPEATTSLDERILRLDRLGIGAAEIGRILRRPTNQVTATLSRQRKKS